MSEDLKSTGNDTAAEEPLVSPETKCRWYYWALVACVALAVGLPSLTCGFIGGDDVQLIRDHVLVNRPSLEHSILLFEPDANRDLYQPIPLLTFAMNFAIVQTLGLTGGNVESPPGAWVFHLTNVLIHAVNALLVFWLILRLGKEPLLALAAALLFSVHPLQVESIAWLNGRMMMLSTLFILLALITFDMFLDKKKGWLAAFIIVFVALSLMSKVRPCLPALLLIIPFWRKQWLPAAAWGMWGVVVAMVGASIWLNLQLSSGILEEGLKVVGGNPIVRGLLGLGWYIEHSVVPIGLAAWYPLPQDASWSTPGVFFSLILVVLLFTAVAVSLRYGRAGLFGLGWFLVSIAALLPIVPSRNLIAADRYMYLSGIGLFWIVAALYAWLHSKLIARGKTPAYILHGAGIAVLAVFFAISINHIPNYKSTPLRQLRIAEMHSHVPGVWGHVGKAYYSNGDYDNALKYAEKELSLNADTKMAQVGHLAGMAEYRLGNEKKAIEWIRKSIEADPEAGMAWLKLGVIHKEQGRTTEALEAYEQAIESMSKYLPAIVPLGELYLDIGRNAEAKKLFQDALDINPYHPSAGIGMAQVELAEGNFSSAADRLEAVVKVVPHRADAWTNLGVCYSMLKNYKAAIQAYEQALHVDPKASTAALNLALLNVNQGEYQRAAVLLSSIPELQSDNPPAMGLAVQAMAELAMGRIQAADVVTRKLLALDSPNPPDADSQLLAMLQTYAGQHPENPFPFYLASMVLAHQGQHEAAQAGVNLFKSQCQDPAWHAKADEFLKQE